MNNILGCVVNIEMEAVIFLRNSDPLSDFQLSTLGNLKLLVKYKIPC